jgi:hypothetical protein
MYRHHDTLTYRFPRTTIAAFGPDKDTACAIVRYRKRQIMLATWLIRAGIVSWVGLMIVGFMT